MRELNPDPDPTPPTPESEGPRLADPKGQRAGVRVIIAYKLVKGSIGLAVSLVLAVLLLTGGTGALEAIASVSRRHFTGEVGFIVARALASAARPRNLWIAAAAAALDGAFTLVEGWALHHGRWWGPWLVVVATASFLPFEVAALVRAFHLGRVLLFVVNVAIVVYLSRRTLRRPPRD